MKSKMKLFFKKLKHKLVGLRFVGGALAGIWWIGVYVHQAWELVHRYA